MLWLLLCVFTFGAEPVKAGDLAPADGWWLSDSAFQAALKDHVCCTGCGAIEEVVDACTGELSSAKFTVAKLRHQLTEDQAEVNKLRRLNVGLSEQNKNLKRQRNAAWAVTGGLLLGATTVLVVAL